MAEELGRASSDELRDDCSSAESSEGEKGMEVASNARGACICGALALIASTEGGVGLVGAVVVASVFANVILVGVDSDGGGDEESREEVSAPVDDSSSRSRIRLSYKHAAQRSPQGTTDARMSSPTAP